MNISREDHNPLEFSLKLEISPDDYSDKVNKKLKDYQRKASIPGFRPGKVPFGMINKMYGRAVMADEINTLVSESLGNYIQENKLETLGTPVPNDEKTPEIDWDKQENIVFWFDLGLAPSFDPDLNDAIEIDFLNIQADDAEIEKEIEMIRKSYGQFKPVDVAAEDDWIYATFDELNEDGTIKEGGFTNKRRITAQTFESPDFREKLKGLKKDDTLDFIPVEVMKDTTRIGYLFNIDEEKAKEITGSYRMTVNEVEQMVPAEMNAELFDKIFTGQGIEDEATFIEKIRKDTEINYKQESNLNFYNKVKSTLLENLNLSLPEEFLKKWLKEKEHERQHEHDHDHDHEHHNHPEPEEKDYPKIFESMKWRLIEDRIIKKYEVKVENDEVKEYVKERYRKYFLGQGMPMGEEGELDGLLDSLAQKYMEKGEELEQIYDLLYADKLIDVFKNNIKVNVKDVKHEEFHKLDNSHHH